MGKLSYIIFAASLVLTAAGCNRQQATAPISTNSNTPVSVQTQVPVPVQIPTPVTEPISNALSRITKKTFGLYVSPGHSTVSPERFIGYHTGVDFEVTPEEAKSDVTVSTICSGPLALKEWAKGYGGIAVQRCTISSQSVTVIYGHLRLSSISAKVGSALTSGTKLGVLGTGYSTETDGERENLHLGIHRGTSINILGYVQNKADLSQWIDAEQLLKQ